MKFEDELKSYKQKIEKSYGKCSVLTAQLDTTLTNCNGTSNRDPEGGLSWINYWRAMTETYTNQLTCSSCGKLIFVGSVPKIYQDLYKSTNDSPNSHIAYGGHVNVITPKSGKYIGGRYIIPLCPACNARRGEAIPILKGTRLCKEIGANINEADEQ